MRHRRKQVPRYIPPIIDWRVFVKAPPSDQPLTLSDLPTIIGFVADRWSKSLQPNDYFDKLSITTTHQVIADPLYKPDLLAAEIQHVLGDRYRYPHFLPHVVTDVALTILRRYRTDRFSYQDQRRLARTFAKPMNWRHPDPATAIEWLWTGAKQLWERAAIDHDDQQHDDPSPPIKPTPPPRRRRPSNQPIDQTIMGGTLAAADELIESALQQLGLQYRWVNLRAERVRRLRYHVACPVCHATRADGSSGSGGTTWVTPWGRLKCWRPACPAFEEHGGMLFQQWAPADLAARWQYPKVTQPANKRILNRAARLLGRTAIYKVLHKAGWVSADQLRQVAQLPLTKLPSWLPALQNAIPGCAKTTAQVVTPEQHWALGWLTARGTLTRLLRDELRGATNLTKVTAPRLSGTRGAAVCYEWTPGSARQWWLRLRAGCQRTWRSLVGTVRKAADSIRHLARLRVVSTWNRWYKDQRAPTCMQPLVAQVPNVGCHLPEIRLRN